MRKTVSKSDIQLMQTLRKNGNSYRDIASVLGVNKHKVIYWLNPLSRQRGLLKHKQYRQAHPEKMRELRNRWRRNNPEKVKQMHHNDYLRNREKILAKNREWKRKHRHISV